MQDDRSDKNANTLSTGLITAVHLVQQLSSVAGLLRKQSVSILAGLQSILEYDAGTKESDATWNEIGQSLMRLDSAASSSIALTDVLRKHLHGYPSPPSQSIPSGAPSNSKLSIGQTKSTPLGPQRSMDFSSKPTTASTSNSKPRKSRRRKRSAKRS